MLGLWLNYALLALLGVIGIAVIRQRDLFAVVMLGGIYSFLSAALYLSLDAVDVAFTEIAVGAGISTVLLLGTLSLVGRRERPRGRRPFLPIFVVLVTGAALAYGSLDLPRYPEPDNPIHTHVAPRYLERMPEEVGILNSVSAVLASYRGYDTLGEATVTFTAAAGVLVLLGWRRRRAAGRGAAEGR